MRVQGASLTPRGTRPPPCRRWAAFEAHWSADHKGRSPLLKELLGQCFAADFKIASDIRKNATQGTNLQRLMPGDADVVLSAFDGRGQA